VHRRSPGHAWAAAALNVALAVAVAQVLEPLGERLVHAGKWEIVIEPARWTAFAGFMAAGVATAAATLLLLNGRLRNAGVSAEVARPAA
jgi:hypothetical protein